MNYYKCLGRVLRAQGQDRDGTGEAEVVTGRGKYTWVDGGGGGTKGVKQATSLLAITTTTAASNASSTPPSAQHRPRPFITQPNGVTLTCAARPLSVLASSPAVHG
ncbi:hypothetical protein O3P69_013815 [Scylla paramamosain]|uniref:Uncharacterized protein n=1 Tax=Scylla paramamosain TaxID=85552 RepID=A0AAW0SRP4_SCYPA